MVEVSRSKLTFTMTVGAWCVNLSAKLLNIFFTFGETEIRLCRFSNFSFFLSVSSR